MNPIEPPTSSRLRRAALAERGQLGKQHAALSAERERLAQKLHQLDLQLLAIDDRLAMLARLAGPADSPTPDAKPAAEGEVADDGRRTLRGTAIRETATRVLAEHPEGHGPIHYRRWFALLEEAGYAISGKDPLAVFLTQISRSPVVKRSTKAGVYSLDRLAPDRLRRELATLQGRLREATSAAADKPADLARIRAQREELHAEVRRLERALDEALRSLQPHSERAEAAGA